MAKRPVMFLLILITVSLLSFTACAQQPDMDELMERGEEVYVNNCAGCHQEDGGGTVTYPALDGNPLVTLHDTAPLVEVVSYGRGGMPAFRERLEDDEMIAVLTYIRNAWGNEAPPVPEKQVR